MSYITKKISRKLFAALVLVAVIPVLIMGYGAYGIAWNVLLDNAYEHMETVAQYHVNYLDTVFNERLGDIHVLSRLPTVREVCGGYCFEGVPKAPSPEQSKLLDNVLALTRGKSLSYQSMSILGPGGNVLASTDPDPDTLSKVEHLHTFELSKSSGEPALGLVHQHDDHKWYMPVAAPIMVHDGSASALALAILDVSGTFDPVMTARSGLGKTGEAYLVNEDGRIITESRYLNRSETMNRPFDTHGIRNALNGRNGTATYRNYTGHEVVGSYHWLPKYRWALLVEMGKDEVLAPLEQIKAVVMVTTGIVGLLCLFMGLVVSRRVSYPLTLVAEASREIANGRLDRRIPFSGFDEIGTLAENFNSMAEGLSIVIVSLRQKEESLQKAYENLLHTQAQLVQSEKMAAIGELVASVVHEMRNPLCSVKLNLQIIGRALPKDDLISEHYSIALDQVSQMEKMFADLMNYSKPIALEKKPVTIEELIDQSLRQIEMHIKDLGVEITTKLNEPLPLITVDPDKIKQVLVNVIKNAIEACGEGGKVEISARSGAPTGKPAVILSILDNGPGVAPQDLKRIFQPFFTTKKKGTGLGLPIVKKILDAHGFDITVAGNEGRGTVVEILIKDASYLVSG